MIPPSQTESLVLALNLLRLLVQNRIAEFHTDLELIPAEVRIAILHFILLVPALCAYDTSLTGDVVVMAGARQRLHQACRPT
jgi:hypothetical protein